jgi:hypothetical protein
MPSLIVGLGSIGAGAIGEDQAREGSVEGARTQANIEGLGRAASEKEFGKQIVRQQPFIDVGTRAINPLIEAISNRGDVSGLPATQIQSDLISDFLGPQAPGFVTDDLFANLEATELERNKGRLSDLVNIGLGGVGSSAGSRVNLGTTLGSSLAGSGNLAGQSLQDAAISRQNTANQLTTSLGGLPAFIAGQRQPQEQGVNSPVFGVPLGSGQQFRRFA